MSDGELSRLEGLRDLDQRGLTSAGGARLFGLERRQVFRLLKAYRTEGRAGLISKRRGRSSNRRKPEAVRTKALSMIREHYWDFGPTLAAEKLREVHQIRLGRETLRLWMIEAEIWADRKQRRKQVHQPRHRRECVGELVQIDGCEHWWFEDRGPQCTLLVFVDDATSRLMHLQFVESESTFAYFHAARAYLEAWGWPGSAPWPKATPCSPHSSLTTTRALPSRRRTPRTYIGRCAPAMIWKMRSPGRRSAPS